MKNIFTLIIIYLNLVVGFSQNSEFIILQKNDTLKSSEFDLLVFTKDGVYKINNSYELLYDNYKFKNNEITSISLIQGKDTLNFFLKNSQRLTFEKNGTEYKSLSLSFDSNGENESKFDFELCKKSKLDIIINLTDNNFKTAYRELIIGIENPEGKYDKELTSKYNIRKKKKEFRKRKRELKKYFKSTDFVTFAFGNNVVFKK